MRKLNSTLNVYYEQKYAIYNGTWSHGSSDFAATIATKSGYDSAIMPTKWRKNGLPAEKFDGFVEVKEKINKIVCGKKNGGGLKWMAFIFAILSGILFWNATCNWYKQKYEFDDGASFPLQHSPFLR